MRKLFIFLFVFVLNSCKKEIEPDLGLQIQGTYDIVNLRVGNTYIPSSKDNYFKVERISQKSVKFTLVYTYQLKGFSNEGIDVLEQNGENIDAFYQGQKVCTFYANGNVEYNQPNQFYFLGQKRQQ